jgi:predicted O-methyltransferase YrrM
MDIVYNEVKELDLSSLVSSITRKGHQEIINGPAGKEHYKLLAYLSKKINDGLIIELGTHNGTSSVAMSINESNIIITYDVKDVYSAKKPKNVECRIGNIFDLGQEEMLLKANFIFLDTAHLGDFELQVYEYLRDNNYTGFIIYDDIHWSKEMVNFWKQVPEDIKYDVTEIGHGTNDGQTSVCGTGIIDFSGKLNLLKS